MRHPSGKRTQTWLWRPRDRFSIYGALKLQGDAAVVAPERDNVEPPDRAREVCRGASFAKRFDLIDAVEILGRATAHRMGRGPEHPGERIDVVGEESAFVSGIERLEFGESSGVVDAHA